MAMDAERIGEKEGFLIRRAQREDAERYYEAAYCPLDAECVRLTGSKVVFTKEEVISFFLQSIEDDTRYFFLITAPDGRIIGETLIMDIDWDLRSAHFRICLHHTADRERGIGSWAAACTRDFAFEILHLHRLELAVYSFNPRALHVYAKLGFKREGVLRDAFRDGDLWADTILMSILEGEWKEITHT